MAGGVGAGGGSRPGRMSFVTLLLKDQSPDHFRSPVTRGSRAMLLESQMALRICPWDAGVSLRATVPFIWHSL